MQVTPMQIQTWLQAGLPGAQIQVSGDGHHFEAEVVWSEFLGKTMLAQHRMVYDVLGEKMGGEIHALSLKTRSQ